MLSFTQHWRFPTRVVSRVLAGVGVLALASCLRIPEPPTGSVATVRVATPAPRHPDGFPYRSTNEPLVPVWVVADDLHTGLVFPYDWLVESGFVPPAGFGNPPFVNMSWGDRTAYVQKEWLNPWQVFRALFTPTPSVMEIIPVDGYVAGVCQPNRIYKGLAKRESGPRLAAFLNHVSRMDAAGRPIVIGPSSWGKGFLLDSKFSYYLPRICNVWTAQGLEACGFAVSPVTGLTADGLVRQLVNRRNGFDCVWLGDGTDIQPPNTTVPPTAPR